MMTMAVATEEEVVGEGDAGKATHTLFSLLRLHSQYTSITFLKITHILPTSFFLLLLLISPHGPQVPQALRSRSNRR